MVTTVNITKDYRACLCTLPDLKRDLHCRHFKFLCNLAVREREKTRQRHDMILSGGGRRFFPSSSSTLHPFLSRFQHCFSFIPSCLPSSLKTGHSNRITIFSLCLRFFHISFLLPVKRSPLFVSAESIELGSKQIKNAKNSNYATFFIPVLVNILSETKGSVLALKKLIRFARCFTRIPLNVCSITTASSR